MNIWVSGLIFCLGVALLVKGGDVFVNAASWIARASGIPTFIVGATIVSVATTLPELLVSLIASSAGKTEMAIGNAVGSVIANTALILSIAMIFMVIVIKRSEYIKQITLLTASAAILLFACRGGYLSTWGSVALLTIFVVFLIINVSNAKKQRSTEARPQITKNELIKNIIGFALGAAGIVAGSQLLVNSGSDIALFFGVPERIIAVTLVAVGTSLPELVTTVTAIVKKESALSVGNLIGANLIDLSLILPLCSVVSGQRLPVSMQSYAFDIPICLAFTAFAFLPLLFREKAAKIQGVIMLLCYAAYLGVTVL